MNESRTREITRSKVVLQGGGRLEGVARVFDVRLEPGAVEWDRIEPGTIEVRGSVRATIYSELVQGDAVEGEGVEIPYATRIRLPQPAPERLDVALVDVDSKHAYDPVTGELRHEVILSLAVTEAEAIPEPPQGGEAAPGPKAAALGQADGETRLSQVRVGPRPGESPEQAASPSEPRERPEGESRERGRKEPLVWKPFPPPIAK